MSADDLYREAALNAEADAADLDEQLRTAENRVTALTLTVQDLLRLVAVYRRLRADHRAPKPNEYQLESVERAERLLASFQPKIEYPTDTDPNVSPFTGPQG